MKPRTTEQHVSSSSLILMGLIYLVTLPVWAPIAAIYMLATGRSFRSINHEANHLSEIPS